MKYVLSLFIVIFFISCTDPSSVDADREKIVIDDPSQATPKFEIIPNTIDFGELLINSQKELQFKIKNLTDEKLTLSDIRFKNNPSLAQFEISSPIILQAKGDNFDNKDITVVFQPNTYGYFKDTLLIDNYKNPIPEVIAEINALFADDVIFSDTRISEFQLEIFNFKNISDKKVTITEFQLIDPNNVFLNEPSVSLPLTIPPYDESEDIKLTFNPIKSIKYEAEIMITAEFEGANYPYRKIIQLIGKGID